MGFSTFKEKDLNHVKPSKLGIQVGNERLDLTCKTMDCSLKYQLQKCDTFRVELFRFFLLIRT